jgi:octaprenyl-diphosphate synthase
MKTAELFALSCDLAACLSNATSAQRSGLRQFGLTFGTAYQVYDDCVDLFGSEVKAGKSLGTDLTKGKLTFPVLLAWERATASDRAKLEAVVQNWQPGSMPRVSELLARYETLTPTVEIIEQYLDQARETLRSLPESDGRAGLIGVTEYLARQTGMLSE